MMVICWGCAIHRRVAFTVLFFLIPKFKNMNSSVQRVTTEEREMACHYTHPESTKATLGTRQPTGVPSLQELWPLKWGSPEGPQGPSPPSAFFGGDKI